jgi:[protein-PII] uridylyltransferase
MDDRLGLLSDVTAVLSSHRLGVTAAQIYTRAQAEGAEAFDVFHLRRSGRTEGAVIPPRLFGRLEEDLRAIAAGTLSAQEALGRRVAAPSWGRRGPEVLTEVQVDNEASGHATVVDIFTRDRPGLLHVIARTLTGQGLTISLSKVNTEGDRVADVFYVQGRDGQKVKEEPLLRALPELLRAEILKMDEEEARR